MASQLLEEFEQYVGLGSSGACRLIGMEYPTYAAYRNESRSIPRYHRNHIDDIYRLSQRELHRLIAERAP